MKFIRYLIPFALCTCMATAQNPYGNTILAPRVMTATSQTSTPVALGVSWSGGTITVTGSSLTTATFGVTASYDNGVTYFAVPICTIAATPVCATTQTVTGTTAFQLNPGNMTHIEYVTSGTFTATSISILLTVSPNATVAKSSSGGGSGSCAGDLSGTYPNCVVAQVNGAVVPASAAYVGTNSSRQIVAAATPTSGAMVNLTGTVTVTCSGACTVANGVATVSTAGATITFSVPSGYNHLRITGNFQGSAAGASTIYMQFNGDTAAHYAVQQMYSPGTGSALGAASGAVAQAPVGDTNASGAGSWPATFDAGVLNYANTSFYKSAFSQNGIFVGANTGQISNNYFTWESTSAITSLTIGAASGNISVGSLFSIYGIL